ncbi:MAG: IS66 family insertion sequence element accessory protein TnpA, partial [Bacteroidota bacterium]
EWLSLIQNWQDSNLSQKEFCKDRGVALSAFQYWLGKVRRDATAVERDGHATGFVPVSIKGTSSLPNVRSVLLEVVLPDGRRINFYEGVDVQFLRALLS